MNLRKKLELTRFKLLNDPYAKEVIIAQRCENFVKRINNLRAVDRSDEARKVSIEAVDEIKEYWKYDLQNPVYIHAVALIYMKTEDYVFGIEYLNIFIENISNVTIDLTTCYLDLGKLYSLIGDCPHDELACYVKAFKATAPRDGKFPATRKLKAECCFCISKLAEWLKKSELATFHKQKSEELSDGVNLDYNFSANDFFKDRTDEPTPETIARVNAMLKLVDL